MTSRTSSYEKESTPGEYLHQFHAGNVGDVWKHVVLLAVLRELQQDTKPLHILDCYAGAGAYELPGVGEWKEGIGSLLEKIGTCDDSTLREYLDRVRPQFSAGRRYLGSPLLIEALLRPNDTLTCYEIHSETRANLQHALSSGASRVREADGLLAWDKLDAGTRTEKTVFALVDPPWIHKQDWQLIPEALIAASKRNPCDVILLWYPIKSYTRVSTMIKRFQTAGLSFATLDLITTPLEHQRNRLNGSGLLLVNGPTAALSKISAAANAIGQACATQGRYWSYRVVQY